MGLGVVLPTGGVSPPTLSIKHSSVGAEAFVQER